LNTARKNDLIRGAWIKLEPGVVPPVDDANKTLPRLFLLLILFLPGATLSKHRWAIFD
jgi:hypothetical protein